MLSQRIRCDRRIGGREMQTIETLNSQMVDNMCGIK